MFLLLAMMLWQTPAAEPKTPAAEPNEPLETMTARSPAEEAGIKLVQEGFLDLDASNYVGAAFRTYPFFETLDWSMEGESRVIVEGVIDDASTVEAYKADHQWSWRSNFKAMQLESIYKLDDDKDKLSFKFYFKLDGKGGFGVESGFLGIRSKATGKWRSVPLDTKPIIKILKGVYQRQNPYLSLIQGLPFK